MNDQVDLDDRTPQQKRKMEHPDLNDGTKVVGVHNGCPKIRRPGGKLQYIKPDGWLQAVTA